MGIVMHDVNEYILEFSVPGTQSAATDKQVNIVPFPGVIRGILARLGTAPSVAGTEVVDVMKNGTTIFSGGGKITFATGATVPTYAAFTVNPTVVAKGDVITIDVPTASATAGKNLAVFLTIRRTRASQLGTDTDSISATSDAV